MAFKKTNLIIHYSPALGRFLSSDPIGFVGGDFNFYRYSKNQPLIFVDPYGLAECSYKISTGVLSCVSNDGSMAVNANMSSGAGGKYLNNPDLTHVSNLGAIESDRYSMRQVAGKNPRDWFLDPGAVKKLGYMFNLNRGAFNLHLRIGPSMGCIVANDDELDDVLNFMNDVLKKDSGNNWLTVTK